MGFLQFLSYTFGWIYTICWSLSFYPQPILNCRRKTTAGSVVDFPFVNTLGFVAYWAYTWAMYSSPVIRHQYALRHNGLTPTVAINDIVFAAHASVVSAVLLTQYFLPAWWGFERAPGAKPSRPMCFVFWGSFAAVGVVSALALSASSAHPGGADPQASSSWAWLDVVYTVSYVKLVVTLVKYAPQILHNYRNGSTEGWAISGMLLDLAGGFLSIAQQAIDSYLQRDWSGITGNPTKFLLGNVSMVYDIGFVFQHYVFFRASNGSRADNKRGDDEEGGAEQGSGAGNEDGDRARNEGGERAPLLS